MTDRFPSLEGTSLWERFKQVDREKKEARMNADGGYGSTVDIKQLAADLTSSTR